MKPLILDFLRRWRWLFVIALLLTIGSSIAGFPFIFAPAPIVALLLDAQRGVFRVVRALPVSRPDQAKAWWFVGVPLLALLSLPLLVIGALVFQAIQPAEGKDHFAAPTPVEAVRGVPAPEPLSVPSFTQERRVFGPFYISAKKPDPWFAAGVQIWVALGYAGFCFFLMQWAPTRPPENLAENVQQGIFGALWGLSMPGIAFLFPNLPRTLDAVAPWHWAVFAASPVFVAFSYFSAAEFVQKRMVFTTVKAKPPAASDARAISGGMEGVPLYLVNFAGRLVLILLAMAAVQTVAVRWLLGVAVSLNNSSMVTQIIMMGLMIGALTTEAIGLRALRVLPLSTVQLAALLSLISWTAGLTSAAFATLWCGMGNPALPPLANFAGQALAMCGWATLALAMMLHVSSTARIFILMVFVAIPAASLAALQTYTGTFAAVGLVSGLAGFALLVRGLKKSAAFYRPRGFFGMTPGQPSAVR